MRRQVLSAGLGQRLANTWRDAVYPKGTISTRAAAVVYTRASKIMEGFDQGNHDADLKMDFGWRSQPPMHQNGSWVKKPHQANFEKGAWLFDCNLSTAGYGPSLLIAKDMQPSYKRQTGELRNFRKASKRTLTNRSWANKRCDVLARAASEDAQALELLKKKQRNGMVKLPQFILRYWPDE